MTKLPTLPASFGPALRFLRKRAHLTQDELGRRVGYSREQIARLENGSRFPDLTVVAALFVPALLIEDETPLVEQLLKLAGNTRATQVTPTRTRHMRGQQISNPIVTPRLRVHTPPSPLLPLIGREAEVSDLLDLLASERLVTVLGAPGIGKTRLALEVARAARPIFAHGVAFVSLVDVVSPADVPYAVLRTLSLTPVAHQSVDDAIADYLATRHLLLVLDNCEHILDGASFFTAWLERAPHLRLLCTSRVPLDVYGEQEWPLGPLGTPDLAQPPDLEVWRSRPALQLLCARIRAADPAFTLTQANLLPLATLCIALDGLPLALELAAVRLRDLAPDVLVQQLLTLRSNGQPASTWLQQTRRNVAERHRTLQAAIAWSVKRLTPAEQIAFVRLGVFIGGCSLDAALQVAAAEPEILVCLERTSLIKLQDERITLLETLRTYAFEQLTASGNLADHENCLVALRWALASERGEIAITIADSLWWFWYRRGLFTLALELLTAALGLATSDQSTRASALNGLASIYLALDDYAASLDCHREGLRLRRQLGDLRGTATVLHNMGLTAYMVGDYTHALAWLDESIAADPTADSMQAWAHKGIIALHMLDLEQRPVLGS